MIAFSVFGAPTWLSVVIVIGIVAAAVSYLRRAR